ncbi:MAG: transporter substrate-binding domain-containing protein, partial [Deltaproteobacteria bacterium]|nr:transporter substrate-binding domain-containing protein [Deltaproteobacteria bacterium]
TAPALAGLEDLGGKEIYVRQSSSYYEHLVALNQKLKPKIKLTAADEDLEDEDLLEMVNAGLLPMVVVDDHKANFWAQVFDKITVRDDLAVNTGGQVASAVRKNSPLLLTELNGFLKTHGKRTAFGNQIFRRYLRSTKYVKNATSEEEMEKFQKV